MKTVSERSIGTVVARRYATFLAVSVLFVAIAALGGSTLLPLVAARFHPPAIIISGNRVVSPVTNARDEDFEVVAGKGTVTEVVITSDYITEKGIEKIAKAPNVRTLVLRGKGLANGAFSIIVNMESLELLSITSPNISNKGLKALSGHKRLRQLEIKGTRIADDGLSTLQTLPNLDSLAADGLDLTDDSANYFVNCPNLEKLWLTNTRISDYGLLKLAELPKLKLLDVQQTRVTRKGVEEFRRLRPDVTISADWSKE